MQRCVKPGLAGPVRSGPDERRRQAYLVSTMISNNDEHRAVVLFDPIFNEDFQPCVDLLPHLRC